jgi:two-component system, chemotaxis family, CheB/CheR fusion protein
VITAAKRKKATEKQGTKKAGAKKAGAKKEARQDFPVVGIGASAGGIEAIEKFFAHVPEDSGIAYVVIQHLHPGHKSLMPEILSKSTTMKACEIGHEMALEPNRIYLNPSNMEVGISGRKFRLSPMASVHGFRLPVDHFFRSLAADLGDHAVCIILSGTGSDGTKGLEEVKAAGGVTIAQEERQAIFSDMPRNAIKTGVVDYVLPVEEMPREIMRSMKHPYFMTPAKHPVPDKQFQSVLRKILMLIRSVTGQDFSNYKQNTIRRRAERRMAIHRIEDIDAYLEYLREHHDEVRLLFKDLLIGVTSFFRDDSAFQALKEKVIPQILSTRKNGGQVRIWVPACSTGEEALSIAMLFVEAMEHASQGISMQIFATDIDPEAIERARRGEYPVGISQDVPPAMLDRFFMRNGELYRIKKEIREMVVFAVQNVISDPPFSKLDLISCRNILIYLDLELQKRILPLFNYVLNEGGFLFLGSSETIGQFSSLFSPLDIKHRIFQKKETYGGKPADFPPLTFPDPLPRVKRLGEKPKDQELNAQELMERLILRDYVPPSVLVNERLEILFFKGDTERYLTLPTGEATFDVLKVAREDLRHRLSAALHSAFRNGRMIISPGIQIERKDETLVFDLIVRPLNEDGHPQNLMIVIFDEKRHVEHPLSTREKVKPEESDAKIASLEQELLLTREYLQTTVEELETSSEELKSTNEELQSTNEELQSTIEELETAKEELQSTNEELMTVNSELQKKLDESALANDDINHFLASSEIGIIFLDAGLLIRRFTPSMTKVFNLISSDIGRPLKDITPRITYERLYEDTRQVLATLQTREREVRTEDGQWFLMRVNPYRTRTNLIDGLVLTFTDISERKKNEMDLRKRSK